VGTDATTVVRTRRHAPYPFRAREPAADAAFRRGLRCAGGKGRSAARRRRTFGVVLPRREMTLLEGTTVIGRASDAAIQIDSPSVSRYHARIVVAHESAVLEDLGSKNGTHVNGQRVRAPYPLADGSRIRLGAIVLTFRMDPAASPSGDTGGSASSM
jgi:hypothetical protein